MATRHPFRFAISANVSESGGDWRALCRRTEALGYSSLLVSDHFGAQFGMISAITSAAEATSSLHVGALVACNDFHHPVMHAKELATIDVLSGGRVEWGMGAGWLAPEYQQAGVPFDPPGVRVTRMQEAVQVMKALFADGVVQHVGTHYQVDQIEGHPKPVQRPHPPLLIGAAGRRMLGYAGRHADIVGIAPSLASNAAFAGSNRISAAEATDRQVAWLREAAGERFDQLEINMVAFPAAVTPDRDVMAARLAEQRGVAADEVLETPHVLIGSADQLCELLEERRERWGVSYWAFAAHSLESMAPVVERLTGR